MGNHQPGQQPTQNNTPPAPAAVPKPGPVRQPQAAVEAPGLPAGPQPAPVREPQFTVEVKRHDPNLRLPDNIDPSKDPEAWAQKIIREGNEASYARRGAGHEKYSELYLVLKDKNDPTKVVAAIPIEYASSPTNNGIPSAITGLESLRISGITFKELDGKGGFRESATGTSAANWDTPFRDKYYGDKPERGSKQAMGVRLHFERSRTSSITMADAILTIDADGNPSRFIVPTYTKAGDPKYQPYGTTDRQALLRPSVSAKDLPKVSTKIQQWGDSAEIAQDKKQVEGAITTYPISFSLREGTQSGLNEVEKISGTLVLGDGAPRVEPAENRLLQQGFAGMQVARDAGGLVSVQRWSSPLSGRPEFGATVKIGGDTLTNKTVTPISFTSADGKSEKHAYMFVDDQKQIHLLDKDSVALLRPTVEAIAATPEQGTFTGTIQHRVYGADGNLATKSIPILLKLQQAGGYAVLYDAARGDIINTGQDGSLSKAEASAELGQLLRSQSLQIVAVDGKPPRVIPQFPVASQVADTTMVGEVSSMFQRYQPRVENDRVQFSAPSAENRVGIMEIEVGPGQKQEVKLAELLPPGVSLASEPKTAERTTLLNGVRVLPFTFETNVALGDPPTTRHQGFFRIVEDGLSLRSVGRGTAVRMEVDLRISGIRVFPEQNRARHTDNGYVPIPPVRK